MRLDFIRKEIKRYSDKSDGLFYAVIMNIFFFACAPMFLKYIWPNLYNILGSKDTRFLFIILYSPLVFFSC